ncbi:MAG: aminoglycoside phosphotransferase family protein [Actinomycetota bacterium]
MFTRPVDLEDAAVVECLSDAWGVVVDTIEYQPVGFGSHHWAASDGSRRWFVTVDDLDTRLLDDRDDRAAAFGRLNAALSAARALHVRGRHWVVAPLPTRAGEVVEAIDDRFVCAIYPFVDGRSSSSGHYDSDDERRAVVSRLVELHRTPPSVDATPIVEDHRIPRRDSLQAALADLDRPWRTGPHSDATRLLLAQHRLAVVEVLDRYDDLTDTVRSVSSPVITHGEPHRGNVIMAADGPAVIDWDTTRFAPAERDLWSLIDEDRTIRALYEHSSETRLDDRVLSLYRLSWDLCEIALFIHEFRQPHTHTADTATAWNGLTNHLDPSRWTDTLRPRQRT